MNIDERLGRLSPATLGADLGALSPATRAALPHLAAAFEGIDAIYRRQIGEHVPATFARPDLSLEARRALRYFNGPYDTLAGGEPFLPDVPPMLPGKAVYPADLTAAALDAWLEAHPDDRDALLDPNAAVERRDGALVAVPYATRYATELATVASGLRAAADTVDHPGLAAFLRGRAAALVGDGDLAASDADWVRLVDAPLEVVIGPFEVYADALKGQKAFYEAMLLAVDPDACARLASIERALPELAAAFPVPAGARPALGGMAPMVVADELLGAGEARAGILASAFNLPNDAGVRATVGWKQVMVRNVMRAKFDACTRPIARRVLADADFEATSFDAYFFHVLLHEVSHGLGPAYRSDGRKVSEACGASYTAIEEAKADTGSMVLLMQFNGRFGIPALSRHSIGASTFGGLFRSIRFGLHEAHGKANVIQYTWLKEKGAIRARDGRMGVDPEALLPAATSLLHELTRLQAEGTEADLRAFTGRYGEPPAELVATVEALADLPIDILPSYPL